MKIRFSGETFDLPPPVPTAGDVVIAVSKYIPVDLPKTDAAEPPVSLRNLRKVLFFAFREGPSLTLAKVRAVLSHRKLGRGRTLVIAIGTDVATGRAAIAFGGQDCPHAEQLCFPRSLAVLGAEAPESIVPPLIAYCAAHPEVAAALRDWSRFSGLTPAVTLADALTAGTQLLDGQPAPTVPMAVDRPFPEAGMTPAAEKPPASAKTGLFLAGAGTYPCAYALPLLARAGIPFDTVIELHPARAARVAKRFGFAHADTDTGRGLQRLSAYEAPILVIATYHSTHIDIAEQALAINPATRIMLEKPPVTTLDQLDRLRQLRRDGAYIEIGYNRRHIPMTAEARMLLLAQQGPVVMTCIVKELGIPPSHWYRWPAQGTRITGNLCHWLDLGRHFITAEPERLFVVGARDTQKDDNATIIVRYADGSRLNIIATEHGSSLRGVQEFIELRRNELTVRIEDFLRIRVQLGASQSVRRSLFRDKGHGPMYARFIENVASGTPAEYPDDDLLATTFQYVRASAALYTGASVTEIDLRGAGRPA